MAEHPCLQEGRLGKLCAQVSELVKFKDNHETGSEKIWTAINNKASRAFMVTVLVLTMALVTALFGLTYETTLTIKDQVADIKTELGIVVNNHGTKNKSGKGVREDD